MEARLGLELALELVPLACGPLIAAFDLRLQLLKELLPYRPVADGLLRVAADHEAVANLALADDHFLDLEVVGDLLVAARPGKRGSGLQGALADLLAHDVVAAGTLQVAPVLRRRHAAVG